MIEIIRADKSHKDIVLELMDEFRTEVTKIVDPLSKTVSQTARQHGSDLFYDVVLSKTGAIFLAKNNDKFVGIVTIYKIPQIRKGMYVGEIEEMYVGPAYQGKGAASLLVEAVLGWAKDEGLKVVRLESSSVLERAHKFYEKSGFKNYGSAYERIIK